MKLSKPPKRKEPSIGQIKQWLKDKGHPAAKADNINSVDDVLKMHGKEKANEKPV